MVSKLSRWKKEEEAATLLPSSRKTVCIKMQIRNTQVILQLNPWLMYTTELYLLL